MSYVQDPLVVSTNYQQPYPTSHCGGLGTPHSHVWQRTWDVRRARATPWPNPSEKYPQQIPYEKGFTEVIQNAGLLNGKFVIPYLCFGIPVQTEYNDAISSAVVNSEAKVFDALQRMDTNDFNLGVALVEMRETVGLIGTTALRLGSAFRSLKRFDLKGVARALSLPSHKSIRRPKRSDTPLKFASRSWLELVFGWQPLLSDVHSASAKAAEVMLARDDDIVLRTGVKSDFAVHGPTFNYPVNSTSVSLKVGYVYYLNVVNPKMRQFASMGLTNPLEVAWEAVPFSFVVDWFLPVGKYLSRLSAFHGYSILASSRSVKSEISQSSVARPVQSEPDVGTVFRYEERFKRTTTGLPNGSSKAPFVDLAPKLGIKRTTTALSLLHQIFGK